MNIDMDSTCLRFKILIHVIVPFIPGGNFKEVSFIIIFFNTLFNIFCIFVWFFKNFIFPIINFPSLTLDPTFIIPFFFKFFIISKFVFGSNLVIIS